VALLLIISACNHFYVQFRESEQNILSIAERLALIYDNAIAAKEMEFLNPARGLFLILKK
jgi:hypothetical protein